MPLAKRATGFFRLALWLVSLAAALPAAALANAYTVRGIEVDVEAEDAVTARELAIDQAQRDGLRDLLERLTLPQHFGRLPSSEQQPLTNIVSAYEVEEENVSATRYVGRLSVVYDQAAVQKLLQGSGVPIVLELPPSLLVVPALDDAGNLFVFTGPGGWRDAWLEEAGANSLLDVRLPLGDLNDLRTLSGQALKDQPEQALALAADRHGTAAALLLVARADDPSSPNRVTVTAAGGHGWELDFSGDSLAMDGDAGDVWRAAVRRVKNVLENDWKAAHLVAMDRLARLRVDVRLANLEEWSDIRQRLAQVAAVQGIDVALFSQTEAELVVNHIGTVGQLQRALQARGLSLTEGGQSWRLQRMASRPAG